EPGAAHDGRALGRRSDAGGVPDRVAAVAHLEVEVRAAEADRVDPPVELAHETAGGLEVAPYAAAHHPHAVAEQLDLLVGVAPRRAERDAHHSLVGSAGHARPGYRGAGAARSGWRHGAPLHGAPRRAARRPARARLGQVLRVPVEVRLGVD